MPSMILSKGVTTQEWSPVPQNRSTQNFSYENFLHAFQSYKCVQMVHAHSLSWLQLLKHEAQQWICSVWTQGHFLWQPSWIHWKVEWFPWFLSYSDCAVYSCLHEHFYLMQSALYGGRNYFQTLKRGGMEGIKRLGGTTYELLFSSLW